MATQLNTPKALKSPIAENATADNIMDIPDIYNPSTDYGVGGLDIGFPTECRLPIKNSDGTPGLGRAPKMQLFNGFYKAISGHNFFMQNGGMYTFNQEVSDKIGGYPQGAVLSYYDSERGMRFVRSVISNNIYNFNDHPEYIDGQKWEDTIVTMGYVQDYMEQQLTAFKQMLDNELLVRLNKMYPINSLYVSLTNTCPLADVIGTWQLVASGKALWTGNGTNAGTTIPAGLPNITGTVGNIATAQGSYDQGGAVPTYSGAFTAQKTSNTYNKDDGNHYSHGNGQFDFDASRVNSIFGNSTTVQPPAFVINTFKRIA